MDAVQESIIMVKLFVAVLDYRQRLLLRKNENTGHYELPGGTVEYTHFTAKEGPLSVKKQHHAIFACLSQRLREKTGLELHSLPEPPTLLPAWFRQDPDERGIVNHVEFVMPIRMTENHLTRTPEFQEKTANKELLFVRGREFAKTEISSPAMKLLVREVLDYGNIF